MYSTLYHKIRTSINKFIKYNIKPNERFAGPSNELYNFLHVSYGPLWILDQLYMDCEALRKVHYSPSTGFINAHFALIERLLKYVIFFLPDVFIIKGVVLIVHFQKVHQLLAVGKSMGLMRDSC